MFGKLLQVIRPLYIEHHLSAPPLILSSLTGERTGRRRLLFMCVRDSFMQRPICRWIYWSLPLTLGLSQQSSQPAPRKAHTHTHIFTLSTGKSAA